MPEEDSEQSAEGTLLHKLAADKSLSRAKLKAHQRDLLDTNDRLVKEVFRRVSEQFGIESIVATAGGFEKAMWLHRGIKSLYPGHADIWEYFADLKLLVIIDEKFGYKVVDHASANLQLRSYGCMGDEIHDCNNIVVAITQPRLSRDEQLTMAVYGREEIAASRQQLYSIWDGAKDPEAPLVAGADQCRYCKAKIQCPAFTAKVNGGRAPVVEHRGLTKAAMESRIEQCTPEQVGGMIEAVRFASFLSDPLMNVARAMIRNNALPGYRLGKESDMREITDVDKAVELLTDAGLPREQVMGACSMTLGDDGGIAEVYRKAKGGTWKETKDEINTLLAPVIEWKKKRPSVERVK